MLLRNFIFTLALALVSQASWGGPISLSAEPGGFSGQPIKSAAATNEISGTMQLKSFRPDSAWPPAVYMGMYQGKDRNNSIQVVAIRNKPSDTYLVTGYRLVIDGKEQQVTSIGQVSLNDPIQVWLSFNKGIATVRINQFKPAIVRTPLTTVATYVSVSSGAALFNVVP